MTNAQREEIEEEIRILKTIHQAYLTHPELGGPEAQRVEHLLDIMERIDELQTLLTRTDHGPTDAD